MKRFTVCCTKNKYELINQTTFLRWVLLALKVKLLFFNIVFTENFVVIISVVCKKEYKKWVSKWKINLVHLHFFWILTLILCPLFSLEFWPNFQKTWIINNFNIKNQKIGECQDAFHSPPCPSYKTPCLSFLHYKEAVLNNNNCIDRTFKLWWKIPHWAGQETW